MSKVFYLMFPAVIAITMVSCGNSPTKTIVSESSDTGHYDYYPYDSETLDSKETETTSTMRLQHLSDSYEDGYQDGEAAAEEDRLAGRPGMQSGGDEDDDDYEDGYDDGYEDY